MSRFAAVGEGAGARRAGLAGGFSFVEVLVVTIVLGLLAALIIPSMLNARERATEATAASLLRSASSAVEAAAVEPGGYGSLTAADLAVVEPGVVWLAGPGARAGDDEVSLSSVGPEGYVLSTTTASGTVYALAKDLTASPTVSRTCGPGCDW